jgi:hypothetical protein
MPPMARPCLVATVRRLASMNGITWSMWKFSQFCAPAAVVWSSQLAYQPRRPPSGMTVIIDVAAVSAG